MEETNIGNSLEITPEEIAEVNKRAEQNANDSQDVAATLFTMYLPRYQALVDSLSSNALRRLAKALVEFPLNDVPFNHSSPQEKEAFNIGYKCAQANFMMQLHTYNQSLEELEKAKELANKKAEESVTETKEEKNG